MCSNRVYAITELGAAVGAEDKEAQTPLHFAAANGQAEAVRVLVQELEAAVGAVDKGKAGKKKRK